MNDGTAVRVVPRSIKLLYNLRFVGFPDHVQFTTVDPLDPSNLALRPPLAPNSPTTADNVARYAEMLLQGNTREEVLP